MQLSLTGKKHEGGDVASFTFQTDSPLRWRAGQFLHYKLPHKQPDLRGTERWFTIASAPFERNVLLTTRLADKGSSFKRALFSLALGERVEVGPPDGEFIVDDPWQEFVFIAGGIGITPYRSILLDLNARKLPINAILLYANRDDNFVFRDELEELQKKHQDFRIKYFVSPAVINEEAIKKEVADLSRPIFYVSGPEPMVEAFDKMLRDMGIPEEHIKRDYFPGYDWP
jgi:ferredoxin-NADP reductase